MLHQISISPPSTSCSVTSAPNLEGPGSATVRSGHSTIEACDTRRWNKSAHTDYTVGTLADKLAKTTPTNNAHSLLRRLMNTRGGGGDVGHKHDYIHSHIHTHKIDRQLMKVWEVGVTFVTNVISILPETRP